MAIIKHIAIKNSNYNAASDYLTTMYDEFECVAILDEDGGRIPRDDYIIEGILCEPLTFGMECEEANHRYGKNQMRNEIKAHHYIISFDPKDKTENGLTMETAQAMGMEFVKKNFPGYQTLVCTHPDGHNGTGNIHVHIVFNSLRIENVEPPYKERKSDCLAGMKHHVSKGFLNYLKQDVMEMCQSRNFYQVDLLSPAKVKITDREYWAQRRGQSKLEKVASGKTTDRAMREDKNNLADSVKVIGSGNNKMPSRGDESKKVQGMKYETQKGFLRRAIRASMENSHSVGELKERLLSDYGISLFESRGRFSFQIAYRTKAIRARQLGTEFEKESIEQYFAEKKKRFGLRVQDQQSICEKESIPEKAEKTVVSPASVVRQITDIENCFAAQGNQNYARKVKISNLKEMTKTMNFLKENGIGSEEELAALVTASYEDKESKNLALKATESRLRTVNLLIRYSGQYFANKKVYGEYLSAIGNGEILPLPMK